MKMSVLPFQKYERLMRVITLKYRHTHTKNEHIHVENVHIPPPSHTARDRLVCI